MKTYKFLQKGARSPFSGFQWPLPTSGQAGAWVEVRGELRLGANGLHVCRAADLAYWLHDELWEVEAEGDVLDGLDCCVARRARLVRVVQAWNDGGAARFVEACIGHAAECVGEAPSSTVRAYLGDATSCALAGYFAVGAYCAAQAMSRVNPVDAEIARRFREERAWQAAWIASELLTTA
jgi:hypothetical protein